MRFLCLHGKGTSASIFKSQTTSFRDRLPPSFTFEFVDGFLPSPPAAGIDLFYPPPYYSFWNDPSPPSVRHSHVWLTEKLSADGPYDGVMCFSQGCSLIASYILYHQAEMPETALPFKCAVFICGGVPYQVLEDVGVGVSAEAWEMNEKSSQALAEQASSESILKAGTKRWGNGGNANGAVNSTNGDEGHDHDVLSSLDPTNVFGLNFSAMPKNLKIPLPTVHVYGNLDPRYPASLQLAMFSDPSWRKTYDHGGGHDVPRKSDVSESIAQLVEWSALAASVR